MTGEIDVQHVTGATVHGVEGATIGTAQHVYLNDATGAPQWISVSLGETAEPQRFAPLHGARMEASVVTLAVPADAVRGAPEIADGGHLEPADEDHLYGYYQLWLDDSRRSAAENDVATMTRSEEQLHVVIEEQQINETLRREQIDDVDVRTDDPDR